MGAPILKSTAPPERLRLRKDKKISFTDILPAHFPSQDVRLSGNAKNSESSNSTEVPLFHSFLPLYEAVNPCLQLTAGLKSALLNKSSDVAFKGPSRSVYMSYFYFPGLLTDAGSILDFALIDF